MEGQAPLGQEALALLEDGEVEEALLKTLRLLKQLNESGLLDLLLVLTSKAVVERLTGILVTTGLLRLADKLEEAPDKLAELVEALEEPVEPVRLSGLLLALRDPEVARGLARLLRVLKTIGSW